MRCFHSFIQHCGECLRDENPTPVQLRLLWRSRLLGKYLLVPSGIGVHLMHQDTTLKSVSYAGILQSQTQEAEAEIGSEALSLNTNINKNWMAETTTK